MGIGRFINKEIHRMDGFRSGGDDRAVYFDGDTAVITRPANFEGVVTASGAVVGSLNVHGPLKVLGNVTATAVTFNAGTVGSMTITNLLTGGVTGTAVAVNTVTAGSAAFSNVRLGSSAGNDLITAAWRTVYTWNIPALPGVVGSTNAVVSQDVAMSGAAVGDLVIAAPIGSIALDLHWAALCHSAANVQLRAWYTGSTGAYTPGNTPFKIGIIKF